MQIKRIAQLAKEAGMVGAGAPGRTRSKMPVPTIMNVTFHRPVRQTLALSCMAATCLAIFPAAVAAHGCVRHPGYREKFIDMTMGTVRVPAELPVGRVIASKQFDIPIAGTDEFAAKCRNSGSLRGLMLQGVPVADHKDVYSTNVPGIGVRMSRLVTGPMPGPKGLYYYPHKFDYNWHITNVHIYAPAWFRIELIKTAPVTGSGPLAAGTYTRYVDDRGNSMITTRLNAHGITIITPSCTVDPASRNILVSLRPVPANSFKAVGTTAGDQPFDIRLQCQAGLNASNIVHPLHRRPDRCLRRSRRAGPHTGLRVGGRHRHPVA